MPRCIGIGRKLRVYPLAQAANPPEQRFIDIYGKTFDGHRQLRRAFLCEPQSHGQDERPAARRDHHGHDSRASGIEKGKTSSRTRPTQSILKSAAQEAQAYFIELLTSYSHPWWPDRKWSPPDPEGVKTGFTFQVGDAFGRGRSRLCELRAFAMPKRTGTSLVYLFTFRRQPGASG